MQIVTIAGRLGSDAVLRRTQGGDPVLGFNVAVDYRQGRDKATQWWRVSLWGKRGEALEKYLRKGSAVTVIGEFSLGEHDGKPQLNVRASEVALQGGKSDGGDNAQRDNRGGGAARNTGGSWGADADDDLSDIPFVTSDSEW